MSICGIFMGCWDIRSGDGPEIQSESSPFLWFKEQWMHVATGNNEWRPCGITLYIHIHTCVKLIIDRNAIWSWPHFGRERFSHVGVIQIVRQATILTRKCTWTHKLLIHFSTAVTTCTTGTISSLHIIHIYTKKRYIHKSCKWGQQCPIRPPWDQTMLNKQKCLWNNFDPKSR